MYLKSIEMYGFKSFSNKSVFTFDQGITAIVGPNGSGKSNIADAVRWVLGEQSAKNLRGGNMKDVIFAGTETRRPLGYCQVDLTIDNTDQRMGIAFTEVTVSRRVYRSGESEYYINGTACRLKDVLELFMDTGVGKEGYSIIGQGQIDKILSSKPEDRRGLFDEAAGIVKYKKRKVYAEKQLEEEAFNLARINDIIHELEGQTVTLEAESDRAKVYLKHKEDLKRHEATIYVHEMDALDQKIADITDQEGVVYDQMAQENLTRTELTHEQNQLTEAIEGIEATIQDQRNLSTTVMVEKEKLDSQGVLAKEQIEHLKENARRLMQTNGGLDSKIKDKEAAASQYSSNLLEMKATHDAFSQEVESLENHVTAHNQGISEKEHAIEAIQSNMMARLNTISHTKSQMLQYSTLLETATERLKVVQVEQKELETQKTAIQTASKLKTVTLQQVEEKGRALQQALIALQGEVEQAQLEKDNVQLSLTQAKEQVGHLSSRHKALSDVSDHYEGYHYSIKQVMQLKQTHKALGEGVVGVVADLIQVDKSYEKAIEIALGANIQNIITDNAHTAKTLIQYLKDNRFGRATFLPLDVIKGVVNHNPIQPSEVGFLGYGDTLVTAEGPYQAIISHLLGRIGVVKDLDAGIRIAKKYQHKVRLVTLAGDVINPGGSMTGGEHKQNGNQFLARKRELDSLEKGIAKAKKDIDKKQVALEHHVKALEVLDKKQHSMKESLQQLVLEKSQVSMALTAAKESEQQMDERLKGFTHEVGLLEDQMRTRSDQVIQMTEVLAGTEGENKSQEAAVKNLMDGLSQEKSEKEALLNQLNALRIDHSASLEKLRHVKENLSRTEMELEELSASLIQNNEDLLKGETEIQSKLASIHQAVQAAKEAGDRIEALENQVKDLDKKRQGLHHQKDALYEKREAIATSISRLEKEGMRLANQKEKLQEQKQEQANYMWDEYEITLHTVSHYEDDTLGTLPVMKRMIKDLKQHIRDLGPVNVNAIESYKKVRERYDFLTIQRDDLIESKEKILGIIDELTLEMENQFKQKFKEISARFSEVFRDLFGGGKAFLEMVTDDNVLEAGIEIVASPPGKKLQSMQLMSGGEKAFTAIALLFAIQSLKPSPFCVLDEIEAALDDANVVRFANYLRRLTKDTQFIIITHRKGTMEVADALYGITMQEKGISTQVSVKLLEEVLD